MEQPPAFDEFMRRVWEMTFVAVARLDFDQRLMLAINRVKMSRRVVAAIKTDDDAIEAVTSGMKQFLFARDFQVSRVRANLDVRRPRDPADLAGVDGFE